MLGSLFNIVKDVATVVVAPVEVALTLVEGATKPVAEVVKGLAEDVKSIVK